MSQKSIQLPKTADNQVSGCVLSKKTDSSHQSDFSKKSPT